MSEEPEEVLEEVEEEVVEPETIETGDGTYEKWEVNIDKDEDGLPFESPEDIDIQGLDDTRMVRALFPVTKETTVAFINAIRGSSSTRVEEGFEVLLEQNKIQFADEEAGGLIKFNAKIQQLKNILFYRKTDTVYVLGTLN